MRTVKSIAFLGAALLLAGCALHPLPDDVTGRSTFQIVQKIRCEARDALNEISADVLQNNSKQAYTNALAQEVREGKVKVTDVFDLTKEYARRVDREVYPYFSTFALSALALGFEFNITETNNAQADSNFLETFSRGVFKLNAKVGSKYDRNNTRKFDVGETFLEVYELLDEECRKYPDGTKNYVYPITGNIGLKEAIETFINLNSRSIDPTAPKPQEGLATFVDTLRFTTTYTAGATPAITLTPASSRFNLVDAQLGLSVERADIHQVAISLVAGPAVRSLAEARKAKNIAQFQRRLAVQNLRQNRTEAFFETLRRLETLTRQ